MQMFLPVFKNEKIHWVSSYNSEVFTEKIHLKVQKNPKHGVAKNGNDCGAKPTAYLTTSLGVVESTPTTLKISKQFNHSSRSGTQQPLFPWLKKR